MPPKYDWSESNLYSQIFESYLKNYMKHQEEEKKKRQSKTRNFEFEDERGSTMMMLASPRDVSGVLSPDLHFK